MAGEFLGVRMEQGGLVQTISTAGSQDVYGEINVKSGGGIDVESGGDIDFASGGHLDFASGGYMTVVPTTAAGALPALGITRVTPSTSGASYVLPTGAYTGNFQVIYAPSGMSTSQSATIDTTSARFILGNSTQSTGLLMGSTASTGSPQFALLWALNSTEWLVVAKTTGVVGT